MLSSLAAGKWICCLFFLFSELIFGRGGGLWASGLWAWTVILVWLMDFFWATGKLGGDRDGFVRIG